MGDGKAMARRKGEKCKVTMSVRGVQGLPWTIDERETAAVEVRWKQGGRHGYGLMFPFLAGRKRRVARSRRKPVECGGRVEWGSGEEEEAARLENVSVSITGIGIERDDSGGGSDSDPSHDVSISVLLGFHGQEESNELKAEVIGTATVSLAELARGYLSSSKEMHEVIEKESILDGQIKQIPITLKNGNVTYSAILEVDLRVVEVPTSKSSKVAPTNRDEMPTVATNVMHRQSSSCTEFVGPQELLGSSDNLNSSRRRRSFGGSTSYEVGIFCSSNLLSWRKNSNLAVNKNYMVGGNMKKSKKQKGLDEDPIGNWEKKEFTCREAQTKLRTDVFFASIDQRDESAGGESACTALVVVFAHALLCNNLTVPTKQDLDMLIRDGSSEWRKLYADTALIDRFPNKHFDLETVASANVRPVMVLDEKSFVGFFQPESFTSLSGAKSFDEIWNEIMSNVPDGEAHVYIVSWNDHFFVLKVDVDACYIIDTLGERLFEGCTKAYMLKFDESSEMHTLPEKSKDGSKDEELIVRGKDCCREFMSRFLAAIPLREELEIEKKGPEAASAAAPHQRLQIEFHFMTLSEQRSANLDTEVGLSDVDLGTVNMPAATDE